MGNAAMLTGQVENVKYWSLSEFTPSVGGGWRERGVWRQLPSGGNLILMIEHRVGLRGGLGGVDPRDRKRVVIALGGGEGVPYLMMWWSAGKSPGG